MRTRLPVLATAAALVMTGLPFAASSSAASSGVAGTLSPVISQPNTRAGCSTAQYQPKDNYRCPPAAMAVAVLRSGKVLFWDGLEGMNRVQYNVVAEFGDVAQDDQSRVATFRGDSATFATPNNQTAKGTGGHKDPVVPLLPGGAGVADSPGNDYDLFCSPLVQLPNGDVLSAGGTKYYEEPGVVDPTTGKAYGVSELQGLRATRIFDPRTNRWHSAKGDMHYGRWYPTLVTESNGRVFVASGVTKLIKPLYTDGRAAVDSGRNVPETETYNPATQMWTVNHSGKTSMTGDDTSEQSLPLFARLHLLPDGNIYYDAAGQTFNPMGQAYDEATWVHAKLFNTKTQSWSDLNADNPAGLPLVDGLPLGFRGSGFSVLLPLTPDKNGNYTKAQVFNGGGVVGPTPGNYIGDDSTTINTIDTAKKDALTSSSGPQLLNRRWYGDAVVLPDGEVFLTNGADRDEVDAPGSGTPVRQTELIDPAAGTVEAGPSLAAAHGRTYHNSAVLLPDARVLIGGHAPIATGYAYQNDTGEAAGLSAPEADSTFQIYSPPYLHYVGANGKVISRPSISDVRVGRGGHSLGIDVGGSGNIGKVVLVRNPAQTHLTDGDQRSVDLRILNGDGEHLNVALPGSDVLPPGPYMLFVEKQVTVGGKTRFVPSVSRSVTVLNADKGKVSVHNAAPESVGPPVDGGPGPTAPTGAPTWVTTGARLAVGAGAAVLVSLAFVWVARRRLVRPA